MVSGLTRLVSHSAAGELGDGDSASSAKSMFTENGEYIIFDSTASNLVPDDTNLRTDIFRSMNPLGAAYEVIFGGAGGSMEEQP
jgi:hypothetical protein